MGKYTQLRYTGAWNIGGTMYGWHVNTLPRKITSFSFTYPVV